VNVAQDLAPRVVIVGTGFGCRIQAPALRGVGFNVVGLVGSDARRTAERAAVNGVPEAFTNVGEAIRRTGAQAAAISVPPTLHAQVTIEAISNGCHVLCEKPFATNVTDAQAMLTAAQTAGVVHMVGHQLRFLPQRALISRVIAQGLIGEPKFISIVDFIDYVHQFAKDIPAWWFNPITSGSGFLGMMGSHSIDQIRSELGEFASLSATMTRVSERVGAVNDAFLVRFRLANGADGVLQQVGGAISGAAHFFRVAGTKGSVWIQDTRVFVDTGNGAHELPIPEDLRLPPPPPLTADPRHQTEDWQHITPIELTTYTKLASLFRRAIEGKTITGDPKPATFADGVECVRVMEAIEASGAANGALVDLTAT
jgi:predicted dehydrogenase